MAAEEEKRFTDIMHGLGESSSLHGVPKIVTSRHIVVKLLWCLLLMGALGTFGYHLYRLVSEFTSYPTKTSVTLQFAQLAFPALSFCNVNPIKGGAMVDEKLNDVSKVLNDANFDHFLDENEDKFDNYGGIRDTLLSEYRNFNNSRDEYKAWKTRLMTEISKLDEEDRIKAGHQLVDFIQRATYEGHHLPLQMFKTRSSTKFGNCFTLDSNETLATGSGSAHSIHIVFNVDAFQYLHDFSSSYGVRMVLHEKGTYPLPDAEGITLSTKYETHIGIRLIKISRLGGSYSSCSDGDSFTEKYGIKYTVPVCYGVCESEHVFKTCNCVPLTSEIVLRKSSNICDLDNVTEWECLKGVRDKIHKGHVACHCKNRCNQNLYSTTMSGRMWPHSTYLEKVLLKETCRRLNDSSNQYTVSDGFQEICDTYKEYSRDDYRWEKVADNYLSVYINFEDLNYEDISEEPLYNTERFLSDIGGALGLYMGASCLTWVELLQVILEIILHLRIKWRQKSTKTSPSNGANRHSNPIT